MLQDTFSALVQRKTEKRRGKFEHRREIEAERHRERRREREYKYRPRRDIEVENTEGFGKDKTEDYVQI